MHSSSTHLARVSLLQANVRVFAAPAISSLFFIFFFFFADTRAVMAIQRMIRWISCGSDLADSNVRRIHEQGGGIYVHQVMPLSK